MVRPRPLLLACLLLGVAFCASADQGATLDILLTNDDGYDAPGIRILRAALEAEGHEVQVIAPSQNRSGSSVAISTHGTLTWRQVEPKVIAVNGTPVRHRSQLQRLGKAKLEIFRSAKKRSLALEE